LLDAGCPAGRRLHLAADGIKRVSMELGGQAPVLVSPTASRWAPDSDPTVVAKEAGAARRR